jgi:hypothetical protein
VADFNAYDDVEREARADWLDERRGRRVGGIRMDPDEVPTKAELADFAKGIDALSRAAHAPAPKERGR